LILYFTKRKQGIKQSKARIVWPIVSLCIGEVLLTPICTLVGMIVLSNFTKVALVVTCVFAAAIIVAGVGLITVSVVKALRGKTLKSSLLLTTIIFFLVVFEIAMMLILYCYLWSI